jgi:hypothetical protein
MSLLNQASTWNTNSKSTKRKSTILNSFNDEEKEESIKTVQSENDNRSNDIHKLLEEMHEIDEQESNLEKFEPLTNPEINVKKEHNETANNNMNIRFHPNVNNQTQKLSNYSTIYNNQNISRDPNLEGFMNMNPSSTNDLLLEKINYMIHMLEEQQHEKTNNITEEFILYSFLGIFVIYIVDSFSRYNGKYKR